MRQNKTNIRLNRICQCVQPILNLASVLANSIQRTRVTCRVCPPRTPKGILVPQIVARGAADLRHGRVKEGRGEEDTCDFKSRAKETRKEKKEDNDTEQTREKIRMEPRK